MAFAVLLLVSLPLLMRLEGGAAERGLQMALARQNARLAIQVGLGQLQKFAGSDTRITATAEAYGGVAGSRFHTGVWSTAAQGSPPMTWLVSGNELDPTAVNPGTALPSVELVGANSSGTPGEVRAPLQPILATGVPGQPGEATIGHYAWWIGDEGVKASVALTGTTDRIDYPPFDSAEVRRRIRQQLALGAGPADAAGEPLLEPRAQENEAVGKMTTFEQMALLQAPAGAGAVGWAAVRPYFNDWTVAHLAVLADTRHGGLRQDLSQKPGLLGEAFAAWARPSAYMENPAIPATPGIAPGYPEPPAESMRRRYRLTSSLTAAGLFHGVAPVLSYFLVSFNVRTDQAVSGASRPLEVRARWLVSLWNPYSSALVPEDLQLEVENLPTLVVANDTSGTTLPAIVLDSLYGAPLRLGLPWVPDGRPDRQSWLPGRVHTWAAKEDLNKASAPPAAGFGSVFYTRTLSTAAGQGVQRAVPGASVANSAQAHLSGNQTQLTLRLYRPSAGGGRELLRTFLSPTFEAFTTTPAPISAATYQVTYVFHLAESTDTPASPDGWLGTAGRDPREPTVLPTAFLPGPNGPRPELYPNYTTIAFPDRLLDRALPASAASVTGQSYNEDTPVFELPRGPLLSLGALQHIGVAGGRPFSVGNSWGDAGGWNAIFDRYFLSGLTEEVTPGIPRTNAILPNPLLRLASRKLDGTAPSLDDAIAEAATGFSSKYLLQAGAFNVNSVRAAAWLAVLRSARLGSGEDFRYLDASPATGTAGDASASAATGRQLVFYRFSASAQETFKADAGYAASTTVPPAVPNQPSPASTHLYRRGAKMITRDQAVALAKRLAELVRAKQADSGPIRSLEEFLAPQALFGGKNVLEKAIADADVTPGQAINDPAAVPEFSSQWLTSGDVMTGLAPVFTARSDTFRIRAYGDVVNPATGEVTGRAWAEGLAQRLPEYLDATQPADTRSPELNATNQAFGRRFQIISFRWLEPSDL